MALDTKEGGNSRVLVANRSGDNGFELACIGMEFDVTDMDGLDGCPESSSGMPKSVESEHLDYYSRVLFDLTIGIIAKGRRYGFRRLDKKSLKQRSMAREEASQAQVAPPQFEINKGNVEVLGKDVVSHPLMVRKRKGRPREGEYEPTCKRARGKGKEVTTSRSKLWSFGGLEFNPDFPGRKAFLTQFSPDALAHRGAYADCHFELVGAAKMREGLLRQQQDAVETERKNLQHALEIAQLELNSLKLENKDLQTKVSELEQNAVIAQLKLNLPKSEYDDLKTKVSAAGPSELANDGVDLIPQDKEKGVVGADVVFLQQVSHASNVPMVFEETPETAQAYQFYCSYFPKKVGEATEQEVCNEVGFVQQFALASNEPLIIEEKPETSKA
ncbi:uncharacterized protein G2W53_033347 [Senna tora]|uniref:Uncharacterized protein n=1 Tax=Senna tora TaxID=362788 RepID=A0A834T112_9FABA|nr:uncharacterized protein G2W53_033347 [Senna tora]